MSEAEEGVSELKEGVLLTIHQFHLCESDLSKELS
jgi:hypothetical protein